MQLSTSRYPFLVLFLLVFLQTKGQEIKNFKNTIGFELGGAGLLYSLNYEHFLTESTNLRTGVSFLYLSENQTNKSLGVISLPTSFHYLFPVGKQNHYLDLGIGLMNLLTTGDLVEYKGVTNYYPNPLLNVGYRYNSKKNRIQYKVGISPFWGSKSLTNPSEQGFYPLGSKIQIWGYVGIGYRF